MKLYTTIFKNENDKITIFNTNNHHQMLQRIFDNHDELMKHYNFDDECQNDEHDDNCNNVDCREIHEMKLSHINYDSIANHVNVCDESNFKNHVMYALKHNENLQSLKIDYMCLIDYSLTIHVQYFNNNPTCETKIEL